MSDQGESDAGSSAAAARASLLSAAMIVAPLALFGELLIEKTHHRPLGAVTFASVAIIGWLVSSFMSRRLFRASVLGMDPRISQGVWLLSILASLVVFVRIFF